MKYLKLFADLADDYIWLGHKEIPEVLQECITSWDLFCNDYKIIKWSEDNFNVKENSFITDAYNAGRYDYVSDYMRMKILYEYGGIYLVTDVLLLKPLDDFLHLPYMLSRFNDDKLKSLGTHVIMCEPHFELLKKSIDHYNLLQYNNSKNYNNNMLLSSLLLKDKEVKYITDIKEFINEINIINIFTCHYFPSSRNYTCDEYAHHLCFNGCINLGNRKIKEEMIRSYLNHFKK